MAKINHHDDMIDAFGYSQAHRRFRLEEDNELLRKLLKEANLMNKVLLVCGVTLFICNLVDLYMLWVR